MCVCVCDLHIINRSGLIPRTIRGCQSDTWSAGHKNIENVRGTCTKFQRDHKNEKHNKNDKTKGTLTQSTTCQKNIEEGHSIERWYTAAAASHPIPPPPDRNYLVFAPKGMAPPNLSGFRECVNQHSIHAKAGKGIMDALVHLRKKRGAGAGGSNCRRVNPRDAALGYTLR